MTCYNPGGHIYNLTDLYLTEKKSGSAAIRHIHFVSLHKGKQRLGIMKNVSSLRLFTSLMHDENIKLFMAACEFVCL